MSSWVARAVAVATIGAALVSSPRATALSDLQKVRLAQGDSVIEPLVHETDAHRYVGGVSYHVVSADADHVSRVLRDPARYRELFARLESAQVLGSDANGRTRVRFTHAMGPFRGSYTLLFECHQKGTYCKFRVDRTSPNDLDDGWGFVRLTQLPGHRTLVTWAVLVDVGGGIVRSLFEDRIQRAILDVPRRLAHAAS